MRPLALAWRSLVRQPARSALAILGVAAVGALLFDMLLLSRGLVLSFEQLLNTLEYDIRVTATRSAPTIGPRIEQARRTSEAIEALDEVAEAIAMRIGEAELASRDTVVLLATEASPTRPWSLETGRHLEDTVEPGTYSVLISRALAEYAGVKPGDTLRLTVHCASGIDSLGLPDEFRVRGIARFPFDPARQLTAAVRLDAFTEACGAGNGDVADVLLLRSAAGSTPEAAVAAIRRLRPDLHAFSNDDLIRRFSTQDFSYFRQISFVLSTVTLLFAFLLITCVLTVSVNQRFAEIAALRALGFRRGRIVADLLWESGLMVTAGGLLALPVGALLALWLDGILRQMPGIPGELHFFVLHQQAVLWHLFLLSATGLLAAAYPVWLAARLPIATTLRREIVS